ncbi:hypothetical protein [uncultured Bacteroides sp.]|uniref:hypothetical protein n=1 Tax=uncultured Bacteroides sp. TaxID=162156 RepID=UPI00272DAD70|nr:hypothetical protein [uncultured Bacteroides sp.]
MEISFIFMNPLGMVIPCFHSCNAAAQDVHVLLPGRKGMGLKVRWYTGESAGHI